jgi:hypothetical protein
MLVANLDPAIFAVPSYADSPEDVAELVATLVFWNRLCRSGIGVRVTQAEHTLEALVTSNSYPMRNDLAAMIELFGLSERYSALSLMTIYNQLIERSAIYEDVIGVRTTRPDEVVSSPDILKDLEPTGLREATERTMADTSLCSAFPLPDTVVVLASALPPSDTTDVSLRIVGVEVSGPNAAPEISGPLSYETRMGLPRTPYDVFRSVSSSTLWQYVETAEDVHLAISVRCMELLAEAGLATNYLDLPAFFIGSDFIHSLQRSGAFRDGPFASVTLDCCARIVMGQPKNTVGELRNKKRKALLRDGDSAPARRTHITKAGLGLRLHFWSNVDGPEFANIGVKNELYIAEGSRDRRVGRPAQAAE